MARNALGTMPAVAPHRQRATHGTHAAPDLIDILLNIMLDELHVNLEF